MLGVIFTSCHSDPYTPSQDQNKRYRHIKLFCSDGERVAAERWIAWAKENYRLGTVTFSVEDTPIELTLTDLWKMSPAAKAWEEKYPFMKLDRLSFEIEEVKP